jgi:hypothetical protein
MSCKKVPLGGLNSVLKDQPELFIGMASFESRCLSVAMHMDKSALRGAIILSNDKHSNLIATNIRTLRELCGSAGWVKDVRLNMGSPLKTCDEIKANVIDEIKSTTGLTIVDVTTFTHEQVLILFKFLSDENLLQRVAFCYNGASGYSVGSLIDQKWLSRGILQVRSVLGYPGVMLPSRKLHLIVLVGFEYERAQAVIERFEPALLSLGLGPRAQSVTESHHDVNRSFFERIRQFANTTTSTLKDVHQFEFSCIDPEQTGLALQRHLAGFGEFNTVVCPMNTKLSTLGTALAAASQPEIQLCYAQPAEYNVNGYSTPGPDVSVFRVRQSDF